MLPVHKHVYEYKKLINVNNVMALNKCVELFFNKFKIIFYC